MDFPLHCRFTVGSVCVGAIFMLQFLDYKWKSAGWVTAKICLYISKSPFDLGVFLAHPFLLQVWSLNLFNIFKWLFHHKISSKLLLVFHYILCVSFSTNSCHPFAAGVYEVVKWNYPCFKRGKLRHKNLFAHYHMRSLSSRRSTGPVLIISKSVFYL